ncbi:MAG: translation initiation factor 2 [Pseudomonadota bacterium]
MLKMTGAVLVALILTGCASIARGTTEAVVINYSPANAKVTTSLGDTCTSSPCTLIVKRKDKFTVTATAPGYEPQTVPVLTKVQGGGAAGLAGNVVVGGVIGVGVDAATGAALDHYPNPVNITLQKVGAAPAAKPASSGRTGTPTS